MNERKLNIFYNVATKLNMTEVARELYISQPAISQCIHELEEELGVKLFDRISKKLYLTHEGEVFLNYSRRILNLYEDAIKTMKDSVELRAGKLVVGASTTIGIYILPELLGKFKKIYKDIDVSIIIENTENIEDLVLKNRIDFAFIEGIIEDSEILQENFWDDELVIIYSKDHRFNGMDYIDKEEIAKEKMIMRESGSGTRSVVESIFDKNDIKYNLQFGLGNTEAIKRAVEADLGISCISKKCIENEVASGKLSYSRIRDVSMARDLKLICHKDKCLNKIMNLFIEFSKNSN